MDLTTGWDFRRQDDQDRAWKYILENKPKLIVGSPMCTMFSRLQTFSGWSEEKSRRWTEARLHIKFMVKVYKHQVENQRWFLHEHPSTSTSWALEEIQKMMKMEGVQVSQAHQCMYDLCLGQEWEADAGQEEHKVHDELCHHQRGAEEEV